MTPDRLRQMADAATFAPWTYCKNDGPPGPGWRFGGARALQESGYAYSEGDARLIAALGPDAARLLADAMDALSDAHSYECWCSHTKGAVCVHCKRREILSRFAALGEPQT